MEDLEIKFSCPKCNKVIYKRSEWIEHFKKKHKDIKVLRLGKEVINL